jgi:UDPglucose 6-dehydrogenase|nr:MAG TPA: nucleotide sugar dehydrogenase [Caudoviricetes sp.]
MKNLICGYGNIGKHILKEFVSISDSFKIYDKYINRYNSTELLNEHYDFAFVCVPTEMKGNGECDTSEVKWICNKIDADVIIIKSAVPVGTCESLCKDNIVISPEYYGTTQHSLESPNFVILGGNEDYCCKVTQLYSRVKNGAFSYIYVDWKTAELAKYMENCWIATKVTFCNEFADIAKAFGIQYERLRQCFVADERVNPSHTYVYPEQPYYDSHCLNKDIPALLVSCKSNKIKTPLMDKVHMINLERKSK